MAEYITKDAVISLFEKWSDGYAYIEIPVQDAMRQVSAIPPADVRPVVLCKECKYSRTPDRGNMAEAFIQGGKLICSAGHDFVYPSLSWQTIVDENHFCAYGERMDSDG